MSGRESRREARKRGPASRQISSAPLVLNSPKTPRRRPQAQPQARKSTPRNNNTTDATAPVQATPRSLNNLMSVFNTGAALSARREVRTPKSPYVPPERATREKENVSPVQHKRRRTPQSHRARPARTTNMATKQTAKPLPDTDMLLPVRPVAKRRAGSVQGQQQDLRRSKRPHRAKVKIEKFSDVEEEPDISDSDADYREVQAGEDGEDGEDDGAAVRPAAAAAAAAAARRTPKVAPARPTARTASGSKLLEIKLQRISYKPRDDRINSVVTPLDVLSQYMTEFLNASQPVRSSFLDRRALRNYARTVSDHFSRLIDASMNNEHVTKELLASNKKKESLRAQIHEVKKKHDELAVNLERLRRSYRSRKAQYESNEKIRASFEKINGNETLDDDLPLGNQNLLIDKTCLEIGRLDKVINPETGILSKFEQLNDKLVALDT